MKLAQSVFTVVHGTPNEAIDAVLTAALSGPEQEPFLNAGFSVHEELHLLRHTAPTP